MEQKIVLSERQRFGSIAVAILSLALAGVFSTQLPKLGWAIVLVATFVLICLNLSPESRKKPTLRYSAGIFLVCLLLLDSRIYFDQILGAMATFWPVMCLLVGIALFKHSLVRSGLADLISRPLIGQADGVQNSVKVSLATAGLSVFGSLGTISIMCATLSSKVKNKLALSSNVVRALCSSMYVLPTTVASASVAAAIPHLDAGQVALLGAPLLVFMLIGSMVPRLEIATVEQRSSAPKLREALILISLVIASGALTLFLTGQVILSIAVGMISGYVFDVAFLSKKTRSRALVTEIARSADGIAPEMLLLAASGLLIFTVQELNVLSHMPPWLATALLDQNFALAALLVIFPLITVAGVHPLILFGVFFPLMNAPMFDQSPVHYLAWTSMFVMSNLLSPASISAILAATSLQKSSRETSYLSNWLFCSVLAIFTFAYLSWLAGR
jgi:hypothetical protein